MRLIITIPSNRSQHSGTQNLRLPLLTCLVLSLLLPSLALAQTTAPAPLPPEAEAAMKKGIIAAKQQEWLIAIQSFQEARKVAPESPVVFYNLGLAESKIPGRELRAIAWFGAYLTAIPNAPNAAAVNDFIVGLQIKNQGNINRLIKTLLDLSINDEVYLADVAGLWAEAGDMTAAMNTVDSIHSEWSRSSAREKIVKSQVGAGDITGAIKTADSIRDDQNMYFAENEIFYAQLAAGDVTGAIITRCKKISDQIQDGYYKGLVLLNLSYAQTLAGDMAGAKETLASVRKIADSIDPRLRSSLEPKASRPADLAQISVQPAVRVTTFHDWLDHLDGKSYIKDDHSHNLGLSTGPFLDLASYLRSLPPSDNPRIVRERLRNTANELLNARNVIDQMLKQQAKK